MTKQKTEYQEAVGKLISAIQKEWGEDLSEQYAEFSEDILTNAHRLLQAKTPEAAKQLLGPLTVRQYVGDVWVQAHPNVKPAISAVEEQLK